MSQSYSQSTLWSLRWTPARGTHWKNERGVTPETQDAWLARFRADEPSVTFTIALRAPKAPK